jgi:hypothetical protein
MCPGFENPFWDFWEECNFNVALANNSKYAMERKMVFLPKFRLCEQQVCAQFGSIYNNRLHYMSCASELTKSCPQMSFHLSPILEFPHTSYSNAWG